MAETDLRRAVCKALRSLDAISVENRVYPGTPDVNYAEGWIELKWLRDWPKRPETPVRLEHPLTQEQKIWLTKRWRAGGNAFVLLQVKRDYLLFTAPIACGFLGLEPRAKLCTLALKTWQGGMDWVVFKDIVASRRDEW